MPPRLPHTSRHANAGQAPLSQRQDLLDDWRSGTSTTTSSNRHAGKSITGGSNRHPRINAASRTRSSHYSQVRGSTFAPQMMVIQEQLNEDHTKVAAQANEVTLPVGNLGAGVGTIQSMVASRKNNVASSSAEVVPLMGDAEVAVDSLEIISVVAGASRINRVDMAKSQTPTTEKLRLDTAMKVSMEEARSAVQPYNPSRTGRSLMGSRVTIRHDFKPSGLNSADFEVGMICGTPMATQNLDRNIRQGDPRRAESTMGPLCVKFRYFVVLAKFPDHMLGVKLMVQVFHEQMKLATATKKKPATSEGTLEGMAPTPQTSPLASSVAVQPILSSFSKLSIHETKTINATATTFSRESFASVAAR